MAEPKAPNTEPEAPAGFTLVMKLSKNTQNNWVFTEHVPLEDVRAPFIKSLYIDNALVQALGSPAVIQLEITAVKPNLVRST